MLNKVAGVSSDIGELKQWLKRGASGYKNTITGKPLLTFDELWAQEKLNMLDKVVAGVCSGNGNIGEVEPWLKEGANVHAEDDKSLKLASQDGHHEVVKLLLANGADFHTDNDICLKIAKQKGHFKVLKELERY